jgi:DNA-binding SARP family transcriptional activator
MLGGLQFRAGDDRDPSLVVAHEKRMALLAYLAAARPFGLHRRDFLVALLWPELDQEHARAALRKTLYGLRHAIGADAFIANGDETLGISEAAVWSDVRAFDLALGANRHLEALALYRGDFLPGVFVSSAPGFYRWVEAERQALRAKAIRAAWIAAAESERGGNTADAVHWARFAQQLAPDDENGARRLISLLVRLGDRAGAIRAYERLELYLASELDLAPSAATTALVQEIRSHRAIHTARTESSIPTVAQPQAETKVVMIPGARRRRRPAAIGISLVAVAILVTATATRRQSTRPSSLDNARVAVMPLQNETGRADLDFVGLEAQDWVTRGLQETGLGKVFGPETRANVDSAHATTPHDAERDWAARLGAGLLVRGRYYLRADSILLQVSIIDVGAGDVLASLPPAVSSASDPTVAIEALRRRTIAVLATQIDPAMQQWARSASQPPSFEAYREFSEGQKAQNQDDYNAAIAHYKHAAVLDSGYVYPLLIAAEVELAVRSADSAAGLLRSVRDHHLRLAPFDEAYASALEASLAHDFERSFEAMQRLRRYVTPGSDWELDAAAAAIALNRPRAAMEIVNSVDLHRAPALDHWDVFVPISNAYHLAGENAALLALLRKEAGKWQHAALVVVNQMQALAALGRPAEADSMWRTLLQNRGTDSRSLAMWAAGAGASELRAHGSPAAARRLAQEALDSLPTLPATSRFGNPLVWRMEVLREAGRESEAFPIAQKLFAEHPHNLNLAATIAVLQIQLGDTARGRWSAAHLPKALPHDDPRNTLFARARIAATLGDKRGAVALLHQACDHGCLMMEDIHIFLEFDRLRQYQPFQDFLRPRES